MVIWSAPRGFRSRQARPGRRWQRTQAVPGTRGYGNIWGAGVDRSGTVTIVWDDEGDAPDGTFAYRIWAARHPANGRWSRPALLGTGPDYDVALWSVDFAVGANGAVVVTWGEGDGGRIRAVYRPAGQGWTEPVTLPSPLWPNIPVAAIDSSGTAAVAYRAVGGHIVVAQGSAAGWPEPVTLPARGDDFELAAGRGSELVLFWRTPWRSLRTARMDHGTWRARRLAGPARTSIGGLVAAADGSATFVWQLGGHELVLVHQQRGGSLRHRTALTIGPLCDDYQVTGNRRGDVVVAWATDAFGKLPKVHLSYWARSRGPLPAPVTVGVVGGSCTPAAAVGPYGSVLVAWDRPKMLMARRATTR